MKTNNNNKNNNNNFEFSAQCADEIMTDFICAPEHRREVVTHNGEFHCDEVMAVAILRLCVGKFKLIRTRDPEFLKNKKGRIIVDVGESTFDHHGKSMTFHGPFKKVEVDTFLYNIPHCGASLVARSLERLNRLIIGKKLYSELYEICVQDNGIRGVPFERPRTSFVHMFNMAWNEDRQQQDKAFEKAVEVVVEVLRRIMATDNSDMFGQVICEKLPLNQKIVLLPTAGLPWAPKLALPESEAVYVVYQGDNDTWYVQCVPVSPEDWKSRRKDLPLEWLDKSRNDGDFIFCHSGRFIAGFKTKEAALRAAQEALSL